MSPKFPISWVDGIERRHWTNIRGTIATRECWLDRRHEASMLTLLYFCERESLRFQTAREARQEVVSDYSSATLSLQVPGLAPWFC